MKKQPHMRLKTWKAQIDKILAFQQKFFRKNVTYPFSNENYINDYFLCEEVPLGIVG
jgi:hypothetical protein